MRIPFLPVFAAAALLLAGLAGCNSQPAPETSATQAPVAPADSLTAPADAAAYSCSMKCEGSASDRPGKCPVCGMALEPVAAGTPAS